MSNNQTGEIQEGINLQPHTDDMFLLGLLLNANQAPNGWQDFLNAFRSHFNVHSCHIYIANMKTMAPRFQEFSGPQPSDWAMKEYLEKYFISDYTHLAVLRGEPHQWFASNLMPNRKEVESSPAHIEWANPNNIHYIAGTTLFRQGAFACVLVHNRGLNHGEYTKEDIDRYRALSPYIEKAMQLRIELAENNNDRLHLRAALNQLRIPVATLNEFGEVIATNNLMNSLLDSQQLLLLQDNKHLVLTQNEANKALQTNITQSVSIAKGVDLSYDSNAISITDTTKELTFSIGAEPIIEIEEGTGEKFIGAMVYAVSADLLPGVSEAQLRSLYQLTNAEARVCHLFSHNMSPKEIAKTEKKSIHTIREQLGNTFVKTKTKNQLQLTNLLASLPVIG